jgi:hypothetical protein
MSHGKLREDKTCLNCGHQVEEYYCTHCGQENVETRQPFYFLITHFIEDFVHYDGSFFKTIKTLFLKPGIITNEYLSGKRNSSVNPVKMYIFVSFVTFFLIAVIPSKSSINNEKINDTTQVEVLNKQKEQVKKNIDSLNVNGIITKNQKQLINSTIENGEEINLDKLDPNSIKKIEIEVDKKAPILTRFITKYRELRSNDVTIEDIVENIVEHTLKLIPKALFVYMPIFAFLLWLFYNKKKYWYFDHGIFTLHYFSVILISVLLIYLLTTLSTYIEIKFIVAIIRFVAFLIGLYTIVNFIYGLRRRYQEKRIITLIKGILLIGINSFIFFSIVFGIIIYSYLHL